MTRMTRIGLLLVALFSVAGAAFPEEQPGSEPWQRDWREFGKLLGKLKKEGERFQKLVEPLEGKSVEWEGLVAANHVKKGPDSGSLWVHLGTAKVPPDARKPAVVKVLLRPAEEGRDAWLPMVRGTRVTFRAILAKGHVLARDAVVVLTTDGPPGSGVSLVLVMADEGIVVKRPEPKPAPAVATRPETKPEAGAPREDGVGSGKVYRIWREEKGPVKSFKLSGLAPVPLSALAIPLEFEANPGMEPEAFEVRMKIVTVDEETKKPTEVTTTVASQGQEPGARRGRTRGMFLPTRHRLKGKGQVTVYLVRKSDKSKPDAAPISNALVVPVVIE